MLSLSSVLPHRSPATPPSAGCFQKAIMTLSPCCKHLNHYPQDLRTSQPHFLPLLPGRLGSNPTQFLTCLCINGTNSCIFTFARDVLSTWTPPSLCPASSHSPSPSPPTPASRSSVASMALCKYFHHTSHPVCLNTCSLVSSRGEGPCLGFLCIISAWHRDS